MYTLIFWQGEIYEGQVDLLVLIPEYLEIIGSIYATDALAPCVPGHLPSWFSVYEIDVPFSSMSTYFIYLPSLRWRHNGRDCVSNHQPHDWLLNRLFRHRSKKTSKLRVTGLCAVNSPGTGEFPAQRASYAENVSIWWRHHVKLCETMIYIYIIYIYSAEEWLRMIYTGVGPLQFKCQSDP